MSRSPTEVKQWWWGETSYNYQERAKDDDIFSQDDGRHDGGDKEQEEEDEEEVKCPDYIKRFAYSRVDWKEYNKALKPGVPVDHLYWPNFIVTEPNATFFTGPYAYRPSIVFWAPSIFWPR